MICRPRLSVPMTHSNHRRTSERCSYGCCGRPSASPVPEHWGDAGRFVPRMIRYFRVAHHRRRRTALDGRLPRRRTQRDRIGGGPTLLVPGGGGDLWRVSQVAPATYCSSYCPTRQTHCSGNTWRSRRMSGRTSVITFHVRADDLGPANAGRSSTATSPHPAGDHIASLSPT
jgi:hypothetical protein